MEACQAILDNKEVLRAGGLVAVLAWEAWLGKTDKVKAASTLELLFTLFSKKRSTEDQNNDKAI